LRAASMTPAVLWFVMMAIALAVLIAAACASR
jgi:hypothetical protein